MKQILLVVWLVVIGVSYAAGADNSKVLCGFESKDAVTAVKWSDSAKVEYVADHATEGKAAAKVTFTKGKYEGFTTKDAALLAGWDKYDMLAIDVFNPGERVSITLRIDDDKSLMDDDYAARFTISWQVLPGENHFELELNKLLTPGKRLLDPSKIKLFALWSGPAGTTLFIDNFRLSKTEQVAFPATLLGFDFGPEKSLVWPGFKFAGPATIYSDATGFGFKEGQSLVGGQDAPRAIVSLGKDSVYSQPGKPLVFDVKLKPGKYRIWACTGYVSTSNWPRVPYSVSCNGKELFQNKFASKDMLKTADYQGRDFSSKSKMWDLFMLGQQFDEFQADITLESDQLELTVESQAGQNHLRGLAIWPADDKDAANAFAKVQEDRLKMFDRTWREIKPAARPQPPEPTAMESACGFMLASRNYLETITPYFVPQASDRLTKISIAAAPGQNEPAVFIVYPTKDVQVSVDVSDLTGPAGKIPSKNVRVNYVHYRYCRGDGLHNYEDAYMVMPNYLVPESTLKLQAGVARQFWMTVQVPADTMPGRHTGMVTISAGKEKTQFPLELEVYPFKLDTPAEHGITYAHVNLCWDDPAHMEANLRCYAERGCNSITPFHAIGAVKRENGKLVMDFHRLDQLMELMKKVGMTGPVPLFDMSVQGENGELSYPQLNFVNAFKYKVNSQAYLDDVTEMTALVIARAKDKNYLPVLMYPSTEVSNDRTLGPPFNSKLIQAMRKAGKIQTISSVNTPPDLESAKELDNIMVNFGVSLDEAAIKKIRDAGAKLWLQNVGQTRYTDGLFMLRTGAVGRRQWVGACYACDPYSDWDGFDSNNLVFPSSVGTLPSVRFEWMSSGVNDLRYFLTLNRLIEEAGKSSSDEAKQAAAAAKKDYDQMIASCPIGLPDGVRIMPDGLSVIDGFKDKETFDRYRNVAARHITKLWHILQKDKR